MRRFDRLTVVHKGTLGALVYLAALCIGIVATFWTAIIGGNPYTFKNVGPIDFHGVRTDAFQPGETAGLLRQVCAEKTTTGLFFPALIGPDGLRFALPQALVERLAGCTYTRYGFTVPDLPPGRYTIVSTVRFQNNLVGRDEYAALPPMQIEILPK